MDDTPEPATAASKIFPCHYIRDDGNCSCGKACSSPGKHPLTSDGLKSATGDQAQIEKWWKVNPRANIGVLTGAENNLVVIDIDAPDGFETLLAIEEEHGHLPPTVEAITGSGGRHLYYRYPPGVTITSRNGWRKGIDIKADGGYVIAPPSRNQNGVYRWDDGCEPGERQIADLPAWLLDLLPGQPGDKRRAQSSAKPSAEANGKENGKPSDSHYTFHDSTSAKHRAACYVAKAAPASEGYRNQAAFNLAGHVLAFGLSAEDTFELLREWNARCLPPLDERELWGCVQSAFVNGTPRKPKESRDHIPPHFQANDSPIEKFTLGQLCELYPTLNPPVVDGVCRAGETCNLISVSKVGKSWLAYDLALSIITGRPWLGRFATAPGKVLLVDNELHKPTVASRVPAVARELGIDRQTIDDQLEIWPLRGKLRSLPSMVPDFEAIEPGSLRAVILDAKYRFLVPGASENDNASEAAFYNLIDRLSEQTGAAFVLVHHTSKGSQSDKRTTDVGAGAGAQSRAADAHIVLREHEEPNTVVFDGAVRSFAPIEPFALRWQFPLWLPADDVDPSLLRGKQTARELHQDDRDRQGINVVIDALLKHGPATARQLRAKTGLSRERQQRLLDKLESEGQVVSKEVVIRGNVTNEYSLADTTV